MLELNFPEQVVSARAKRWATVVLLAIAIGFLAFGALVDFVERRAIDFHSAEEIYAKLTAGGFECRNPFFPTGRSEPTNLSTATCERGYSLVHIFVNEERGRWLGDRYSEPWESGEAHVAGRNWAVSFEASIRNSIVLAKEVQAIMGGELRHTLPQEDY